MVHHLEHGEPDKAVRAYEVLLTRAGNHASTAETRAAVMRSRSLAPADLVSYRVLLFADLDRVANALPGKPLLLSKSADMADLPSGALGSTHRQAILRDLIRFAEPTTASQDRPVSAIFAARDERTWLLHPFLPDIQILFATVHAVKGETFDAVVFHTKHRVFACRCPQSAGTWKAVLSHSMLECETKRIAYVACSRAAQSLLILAEDGSLNAWQALASPNRRDVH